MKKRKMPKPSGPAPLPVTQEMLHDVYRSGVPILTDAYNKTYRGAPAGMRRTLRNRYHFMNT